MVREYGRYTNILQVRSDGMTKRWWCMAGKIDDGGQNRTGQGRVGQGKAG
jgi:hypothetical protein